MLRVAGIETWKVVAMNARAEQHHPETPHWYLALLGVDPAAQGRGYGPHLTRPILDRCDAERTPAYLETGTERNVTLYRGLGFEVSDEFDLPRGGPPVWCMWREPIRLTDGSLVFVALAPDKPVIRRRSGGPRCSGTAGRRRPRASSAGRPWR